MTPDQNEAGHLEETGSERAVRRHKARDALKAVPWVGNGHGRFTRSVEFDGEQYTERIGVCVGCGLRWPMLPFVLRDELWLAHFDRLDIACFPCAEARLGRPIVAADLKPDVLGNKELTYILRGRVLDSASLPWGGNCGRCKGTGELNWPTEEGVTLVVCPNCAGSGKR